MSKTRFDLEQEIMSCWGIIEDLKLVKDNKEILDSLGIIYDLKFQKMFNTFENLIQKKQL